jgi:cytochrome c556
MAFGRDFRSESTYREFNVPKGHGREPGAHARPPWQGSWGSATGGSVSRTEKRVWITSLAAIVAAMVVSTGIAETTKPIEARHEAMDKIGDAMKAMAAIVRNQTPFSAETVQSQASTVVENLDKASALFPPGSDKGDTETAAKPEIWTDADGFAEAMKAAQAAAAELQQVTKEDQFRPAFGKLGGACQSCHERYRKPMH